MAVGWPACVCVCVWERACARRCRRPLLPAAAPLPLPRRGGRPGGAKRRASGTAAGRVRLSVRPPAPGALSRPFRSKPAPAPEPAARSTDTRALADTRPRGGGRAWRRRCSCSAGGGGGGPAEPRAPARRTQSPPRPPALLTPRDPGPGPGPASASAFNSWGQTCGVAAGGAPGLALPLDSASADGPLLRLVPPWPAACALLVGPAFNRWRLGKCGCCVPILQARQLRFGRGVSSPKVTQGTCR